MLRFVSKGGEIFLSCFREGDYNGNDLEDHLNELIRTFYSVWIVLSARTVSWQCVTKRDCRL